MADLKREYVVPLRRKARTAPKWRRSKKSVTVLKEFMRKHMKTDDVIVCSELNEYIWNRGARNPPGKVSVTALRTDVGGVSKIIVNLSTAGVDKQVELYKSQVANLAGTVKESTEVEAKEVKEDSKEEKAEVKTKDEADDKKEVKEEVKAKEDKKNG